MYDAEMTGRKLKKAAKIAEIVGCCAITIWSLTLDAFVPDIGKPIIEMLFGTMILILGYVSIMIFSRILEGFGDLLISVGRIASQIDNSQKNKEERTENNVDTQCIMMPTPQTNTTITKSLLRVDWYCYMCGHQNPPTAIWCERCQETTRPK